MVGWSNHSSDNDNSIYLIKGILILEFIVSYLVFITYLLTTGGWGSVQTRFEADAENTRLAQETSPERPLIEGIIHN